MINYRGERFSGYNKPKRTPGKKKKFAVLAKQGDKVRLIRYGDPNMTIKKDQPKRRKSFRARHKCDTSPPSKLTARYWSCKKWRYGKERTNEQETICPRKSGSQEEVQGLALRICERMVDQDLQG